MRALRLWLGLVGTLALAALPTPASAQPVGSEFQINTYTTGNQRTVPHGAHLAAADASGNFVVVWSSDGQDGSSYGIFGQRYDSGGTALGSEFQVNSFTTNSQRYPSVAAAANGDFVVVWSSSGQDGSGDGIFGLRYDSAGVPQGGEFRINSYTTSDQRTPSVAAAADGDFVVVWSSSGSAIFGQRYDSGGAAQGAEFLVTGGLPRYPSVASDASGNFVVVWGTPQPYGVKIYGQRYNSEGMAQGAAFLVASPFSLAGGLPVDLSVGSDASGNFVVVWQDFYEGIYGQRYDSAGVALGAKFAVSSSGFGTSVASDASGNFVVVWSTSEIYGQRYDSAGVPQGNLFRINSFTTGSQQFPSVGATGANQFVVAWESNGQDGHGLGVFGQRYDFAQSPGELLVNGGFEGGNCNPWVFRASTNCVQGGPWPHTGAGYAQLGKNNSDGRLYQQVSIPPSAPANLTFWLNVDTHETTPSMQNDRLFIEVRDPNNVLLATLGTFSNLDGAPPGVYSQKAFSMAAFAGQTVRLTFHVVSNATLPTTFRVDDVSLQ